MSWKAILVWEEGHFLRHGTGFRIYRTTDLSVPYQLVAEVPITQTSWEDTDIQPSVVYYYRIVEYLRGWGESLGAYITASVVLAPGDGGGGTDTTSVLRSESDQGEGHECSPTQSSLYQIGDDGIGTEGSVLDAYPVGQDQGTSPGQTVRLSGDYSVFTVFETGSGASQVHSKTCVVKDEGVLVSETSSQNTTLLPEEEGQAQESEYAFISRFGEPWGMIKGQLKPIQKQ